MNLETLTLFDIEAYDPRPTQRGKRLRAKCPIHGGDRQQSLSVDTETGWGHCFACGVRVRVSDFQPSRGPRGPRWRVEAAVPRTAPRRTLSPTPSLPMPRPTSPALEQAAERLPGSPGEHYLQSRGIPLTVAQQYGMGFVVRGAWPGRAAARSWPRLTFPLTTPDGETNWYSRAAAPEAPRNEVHDVLTGPKGYFNGTALEDSETVVVVEGAFDGLSLAASGCRAFVALIGTHYFRPAWFLAAGVKHLILALDQDPPGQVAAAELAWQVAAVGLSSELLPRSVYAGEKDLNSALMKGGRLLRSSRLPWEPT